MKNTGRIQAETAAGLHICPACGSRLVQPMSWEQAADRTHWRIWRRCPDCEWSCDEIHGEREIDDFDEQLDIGTHELADELKALEHANMTEIADTFAAALAADLIDADDFG